MGANSEHVSNVMRANKGVNTSTELFLRSEIHKLGVRYSIDKRPEVDFNRRADLLFRSAKLAVFVNGCFWHGCSIHGRMPKTNKRYWKKKINDNKSRDLETYKVLRARGWKVVVFWEHQNPEIHAKSIVKEVKQRRKTQNFRKN